MKKTLSLLLTAAMLLAIIPCLAFSVSAAETATVTQTAYSSYSLPVDKYIINAQVTSGTNADSTNWANISMSAFSGGVGKNYTSATAIEIQAKFDSAVTVHSIVLNRNSKYAQRMKFFTISLSSDNETWTDIVTLENDSNGSGLTGDNVVTVVLPDSLADTEFQYVKLTRDARTGWAGLGGLVLLTNDSTYRTTAVAGSVRVGTTHYQSSDGSLASVWDTRNYSQVTYPASANGSNGTPYYTSARLASPTVLDKIVLDGSSNTSRARGGSVYGSVDGSDWEKIGSFSESSHNQNYEANINSNRAYSYVKVEQADSLKTYQWSVLRISVYGYPESATRIAATNIPELNTTADTSEPPIDLWSDTNTTPRSGSDSDTIIESTVAKFDFPTKISTIYLVSGTSSGRNRDITYEGSMDGENWETILKSGHQNNSQYNNATKKVTVNSSKAYLYVRATNTLANGAGKDYHWNVINLAVYGEQVGATTYGTQAKVTGNSYAVRLIASLDDLLSYYDAAGFEVVASGEGIDSATHTWDKAATTVYTSVYETVAGEPVERNAAYFGGSYILAVTVSGISTDYGNVTLTFRPYVEIDGARLYGEQVAHTYNDGVFVE